MSKYTKQILAIQFLEILELLEAGLLSWGLVNGSFSSEELENKAKDFLDTFDRDGVFDDEDELIDYLENKALIFRLPFVSDDYYRTRMCETIRLLSRLRQLFPKHIRKNNWQTAPNLVADYRFLRRARTYPERSISETEAFDAISSENPLADIEKSILEALLPSKIAGFQLRSSHSILSGIRSKKTKGTIICAGTGSGKTLAFYLPAFIHIGQTIDIDSSYWVRCLAIYPRNELLKDQFSETYIQARKIDHTFSEFGRRKLIIGAFFGVTPRNNKSYSFKREEQNLWVRRSGGFVCPYLRCPNPNCESDLLWLDADRERNIERLKCTNPNCSKIIQPDEIILTRDRIRKEPPDILFTTTEMLNQRMSDSKFNHLFGVGKKVFHRPDLVLLDEVHTYSGVHGAQVALLLRRWKQAAKCYPQFVGLSATLRQAQKFFSTLTGINEKFIDAISPRPSELIEKGTEYLIALRGDPVSRTSLLSTTIQTGMLSRRALDTWENNISDGVFGKRIFLFTDDLDVTNRLYFDMLDSEGRDSWGNINPNRPTGSLASLRNPTLHQSNLGSFLNGQSWDMCQQIGFPLDNSDRLRITRTSSQDTGVSADSDIIVASAALEVGFNDPDVGGIIQHKAPRNSAQFIQRKGRAGRHLDMRPWTIVVLSDYGRDRIAYQGYDLLFDPELAPIEIPVANQYVLKMQVTYAFIDWISTKLEDVPDGSVWQDFSGPWQTIDIGTFGRFYQKNVKARQERCATIISNLLLGDEKFEDLASYLEKALDVDSDIVNALLWEPPRALITSVLPTILRRLTSGWLKYSEFGKDFLVPFNPLPEFIPQSLFGDLNLPEVTIVTPPQQRGEKEREDPLSIYQALKEFAPGRISKRFGLKHRYARHWIPPETLDGMHKQDLPISRFCPNQFFDELGNFHYSINGKVEELRCLRVYKIFPRVPEQKKIRENSNAFLDWRSQIIPTENGLSLDLPKPSRWENIIQEIRFFSHNQHCPVEVRRFALGSNASIMFEGGNSFETYIRFVDDAKEPIDPISIGYALDVDGLMIRFKPPDDYHLHEGNFNNPKLRALRLNRYQDLISKASELDRLVTRFQRGWITQIYLSALVFEALQSNISLQDALQRIRAGQVSLNINDVLNVIFQSIVTEELERNLSESQNETVQKQNLEDLRHHLQNPTVLDVLYSNSSVLWDDPDASWNEWLTEKFKVTLGAAFLESIQSLCPDLSAEDLIFDIHPGPRPNVSDENAFSYGLDEIWITETTVGGGGIIEKFISRYGEDPRRFFDLLENSLDASDFELMDAQLTIFLDWICNKDDPHLQNVLTEIRTLKTHAQLTIAFNSLIESIVRKGLIVSHPVIAAINTRILRPGSSAETDALLYKLIIEWGQKEIDLGIEIDPRVFSYLKSQDKDLDHTLRQLIQLNITSEQDLRQWRFGTINSLLWPRGSIIRSKRLTVYNPFSELPSTERLLVIDCLGDNPDIVNIHNENWMDKYETCMKQKGLVILRCDVDKPEIMKHALNQLMVNPIDAQFLFFYPRIKSVKKTIDHIDVVLEIAESIQ